MRCHWVHDGAWSVAHVWDTLAVTYCLMVITDPAAHLQALELVFIWQIKRGRLAQLHVTEQLWSSRSGIASSKQDCTFGVFKHRDDQTGFTLLSFVKLDAVCVDIFQFLVALQSQNKKRLGDCFYFLFSGCVHCVRSFFGFDWREKKKTGGYIPLKTFLADILTC